MRIGELAALSGVPAKTIRYYESLGVLPTAPRTSSRYRIYDGEALDRLAFIRAAQAVGFRLAEIRQILALRDHGETPCNYVLQLLAIRSKEVEQRIEELVALRGELRLLVERAEELDPDDCDPRGVCHLVGARPRGRRPNGSAVGTLREVP
jgi:DNA-binding transcriptional MerR regulator